MCSSVLFPEGRESAEAHVVMKLIDVIIYLIAILIFIYLLLE